MNESLAILATELQHTNVHLSRHEEELKSIAARPAKRLQQIATALISALSGSIISLLISRLLS